MKTIEIKLYEYKELSEEAQGKAIQTMFDINLFYEWWDFIYEDAENVQIKISGFDTDRGNYVKLDFMDQPIDTANLILENWGEKSTGYTEAQEFKEKFDDLYNKYKDENGVIDNYEYDCELEELEEEFKNDLESVFLTMLTNEYEYRYSDEAIIETIEANEYFFTEDGDLFE